MEREHGGESRILPLTVAVTSSLTGCLLTTQICILDVWLTNTGVERDARSVRLSSMNVGFTRNKCLHVTRHLNRVNFSPSALLCQARFRIRLRCSREERIVCELYCDHGIWDRRTHETLRLSSLLTRSCFFTQGASPSHPGTSAVTVILRISDNYVTNILRHFLEAVVASKGDT